MPRTVPANGYSRRSEVSKGRLGARRAQSRSRKTRHKLWLSSPLHFTMKRAVSMRPLYHHLDHKKMLARSMPWILNALVMQLKLNQPGGRNRRPIRQRVCENPKWACRLLYLTRRVRPSRASPLARLTLRPRKTKRSHGSARSEIVKVYANVAHTYVVGSVGRALPYGGGGHGRV